MPNANLDSLHQVYLAKNGKFALPLNISLIGNTVNTNPAEQQAREINGARPHTGNPVDGDNVRNGLLKEIYQVTLTENTILQDVYSEVPEGQYQLRLMVHVATN